jgi:ribonuclease Z
MPDTFSITFLGTRDAVVRPGTFTTSQLVSLGETDVLVDAGLGASAQLRAAGLGSGELEAVVLTHWHPDHVAGLPNLVRRGGSEPLRLIGPAPPSAAWWRALKLGSLRARGTTFEVVEPGTELELGGLELHAFATEHGTSSVGWRFAEKGGRRTLAIPGDSRPSQGLADDVRGVDLLVFEATFLERDRDRAVASSHATALEAGELAAAAEVGALALTHLSARYPRDEVAAEARSRFAPVLVPADLDRIELGVAAGGARAEARLLSEGAT